MPRVSQNSNIATCFFVRERKRQTNRQVNRRTETGRERQRERESYLLLRTALFLSSQWMDSNCLPMSPVYYHLGYTLLQQSFSYVPDFRGVFRLHKSLWYSFFVKIVDNFSMLNNFAKMLYHKYSTGSWISAFVCWK